MGNLSEAKSVFLKNNPKFYPSYLNDDIYISYVWLTLKRLKFVNHWAVVFKLSNYKYGIVQI